MSVATILPVLGPPHDPFSLLLDGRVGWSQAAADGVRVGSGGDGTLSLAMEAAALTPLTSGAGTFGGLRPPATVAVAGDGTVWLLDRARGRLLRFDPCRCAFVPVRAVGPGGFAVAADADLLYLTDLDGGHLDLLSLPTTALALRVRAPIPWRPTGVVVDRHHQVHVADPLGGLLHTFSRTGRYLGNVGGIGASTVLAVDRSGTVHAAGPVTAYRIQDGVAVEITASADELAEGFAPNPVPTDAAGNLLLGRYCTPPIAAAFDAGGGPVAAVPAADRPPLRTTGTLLLGPLDARIDGCTWDRVVLNASVPPGCAATVATFTAHVPLPREDVEGQPDSAWRTRVTAAPGSGAGWDCLVTSAPGRYLWISLQLTGSGWATPTVAAIEVSFPRVSLRRHLPAVYGADPDSASFTDRFLALFDRSLRDVEQKIDALPALLDPHATPALDWLSSWVGLLADPRLPAATRRRLLAASARLYDLRGTPTGLRELLLIVLGLDGPAGRASCAHEPGPQACCPPTAWTAPALVLEHFRLRRWLWLGRSRLGDEAALWGKRIVERTQLGHGAQVGGTRLVASQDPLRDPMHVYAHRYTVFLPAAAGATPPQRGVLERVLAFGAPAHTAGSIAYVEPRFRIGVQSSLGLDAVVARVPSGLTLGATPLGSSTLTAEGGRPAGPPRLGTTTDLQ